MNEYLIIFISTILVNNLVLTQFLGLCPFMGVSKKVSSSLGMGFATTFVLTLSSFFSFIISEFVLIPLDIEYLRVIFFIVVIASVVGFTEIFVAKVSPVLHNSLGVYLPLITTNCAVLGVALLNVKEANSFVGSILYGFGSAVGFSLVLVLFSLIRERLESANVPKTFQGLPIALITAGIMSLAFMGFSGIV
jgi:electron transport complex protein RnfA